MLRFSLCSYRSAFPLLAFYHYEAIGCMFRSNMVAFPPLTHNIEWSECPLIEDGLTNCDICIQLNTIQILNRGIFQHSQTWQAVSMQTVKLKKEILKWDLCDRIYIKYACACMCSHPYHIDTGKRWQCRPTGSESRGGLYFCFLYFLCLNFLNFWFFNL